MAGTAGSKGSTDGAGAAARFNFPHSIAVAATGEIYVADMYNHTIRKITPDGTVSTLAGVAGQKGKADGIGTAARFRSPAGLALDAAGTLYVADAGNHTIRKVSPTGVVTTLAGTAGSKGSADGNGTLARFNFPHAIAAAADGTLYVADTYSHTIRQITPAGIVTTVAGQAGHKGRADGQGLLASFFHPAGLAIDAQGTLYVADNGNHTIRRVTAAGVVSTLAGQAGHKGHADGQGSSAQFDVPGSIAINNIDNLYVTDYFNSTIRCITPQGQVTTFAGTVKGWSNLDGPVAASRFNFPFGIAVGPAGWVYVADSGNNTIRVIR
ncbi:MAG: NHL repeat-containing protein [Janthinobacterium lividum]